jgi:UDP-glucuronate 4-epimerase
MAHTYSHLFNLPTTGLRFFTVYGPWGRPDMALFLFTKAIIAGEPINVFNHGHMMRDFTYIDDIAEGVIRVNDKPASASSNFNSDLPYPSSSNAPYRVFNIGNSSPVKLMAYIEALEAALGIEAQKNFLPLQMGDVPSTCSDTSELHNWVDFKPNTYIIDGVFNFVSWYKDFYK